ncbi:hypothetical protein L1D44_15040 [Shewanella sp. Isolate13]|uniref:hypothetical protein n=1 Tax=Shewanella sp. Isolate13 TaxID=2908531 RepID=UPI001EFD81DD|nr:hypothetical protein [Shewanella sp. Isolate13]MCG9731115.1 hypothetical protein [Shewanella sp. Isolate13]
MIEIGKIRSKRTLNNKIKPLIDIKFSGHPNISVPAEVISMLVMNSQYENKKRIPATDRTILEVYCDGPLRKTNSALGPNNVIFIDGNIRVVIPCLELARTLFLHNFHLTRTALRPNGLNGMALSTENAEFSTIRFNRMSDYPLTNLNSKSACKHLIWLMFDKAARKSFDSIYASLQASQEPLWRFDFEPPPLNGWYLKLAGNYDEHDKSLFYVIEIKGVYHPKFDYPKIVYIYHPTKKEVIPIEPSNGFRPEVPPSDPDPQLNLQAILGGHRKRDVVSEEGFSFTLGDEIYSEVMPGKAEQRVTPIVDNEQIPTPEESAVGHGAQAGNAQELDWAINRSDANEPEIDQELKIAASTSQFLLFEQAIELLMKLPDYQHVATHCMELPKPTNSSTMYLNKHTRQPRTFHCAQFTFRLIPLMIVEVDLSDYPKKRRLGSRLFGFTGDAEAGFIAIMQACSDAGVRWNRVVNDEHTCIAKLIKHPVESITVGKKKQSKSQQEYLVTWLNNIDKSINSIDFNALK